MPSAFSVETFARGLVELIGFQTEESDSLVGKSLIDYNRENLNSILMCAAKRGEEVIVPNGSFVPQTATACTSSARPRRRRACCARWAGPWRPSAA